MNRRNHPKLNQEFLANLPPEIIIDILSRLPIRNIVSCKCVCKSWLDLVETHEFVKVHLSKSVPGLAIFQPNEDPKLYTIFEFEDGLDLEHHELHYNPLTKFNLPYHGWIHGSTNGLLFLRHQSLKPEGLFICNPITRDYIKLHCPQEFVLNEKQVVTYGFGASKITGQHKVVRIFHECYLVINESCIFSEAECQVYTLGTRSWRRVAPAGASLLYGERTTGAFVNGNLHWLVLDLNGCPCISCFDLETELFSPFSFPPVLSGGREFRAALTALGDCLCLCDNSSEDEIVIWLMKEYGVEKSWTKEFVLRKTREFAPFRANPDVVFPLKVFKDGDILMEWDGGFLFYYSEKNKTERFDGFDLGCSDAIIHTPSFLSLKSFETENVISL